MRLVDIEPEVVIAQLSHIIPVMRARLQRLLPGPNGAVKAATAIRVAVSHYIVRSDDDDQFLAQLRGVSFEQLAEQTTANFRSLFPLARVRG